jgi:outer membrane receptor protein involved in Fe transport
LFLPLLSYSVGFAYADAKLTSDFALPANNGTGTIVPGLLAGKAGEQLPGSPKTSVSAALIYDIPVAPEYDLALMANATYRSAVALQVAPTLGSTTVQHSSSYEIMNLNAALNHKPWRATVYVTNVFNKEEILAPPSQPNQVDNLTNDYLVNPPREIGFRMSYSF